MENQQRGDEMPLLKEQRQTNYLIHPSDIPKEEVYEEKPSRVPDFKTDVLAVTVLFTVLSFGGLYAAYVNFWPGSGAALVGIAVAFWRVRWYLGEPFVEIHSATFQKVQVKQSSNGSRAIPAYRNGGRQDDIELRNNKTLEHNGRAYEFEGWQLDRMLSWVEQGFDSIRREKTGESPGFSDINIYSSNYTIALYLLKHFGIVDDSNKWTAAGREWLRTP